MLYENGDKCHHFWSTYSNDVVVEGKREGGKKPPRKEMGYKVFPNVNRIGRPKAVTSIPILLGLSYLQSYREVILCIIIGYVH